MITDVKADESRIARGELLCAIRIMHRFLNTRTWINFMVYPVGFHPALALQYNY